MSDLASRERPRPSPLPRFSSAPRWAIGLAYVAGYVVLDWISFAGAFARFGVTPWNPNTGLSFALIPLFGPKFTPLLFVAPLTADLVIRRLPFPWGAEFLVTAATGAGYAAGLAFLTRPATRFDPTLRGMRDLILLMGVAAASAMFVALSRIGVLVGAGLVSREDAASTLVQSWVGDMIGIAVVTPFALIVARRRRSLAISAETIIQVLAIVGALVLIFVSEERRHIQLFYTLFLPIVWMAVRGGLESVTAGILLAQIGLVIALEILPKGEPGLTAFQAAMLVLTTTGLIAGALVDERSRAEAQLRLHQDSLARLARLGGVGQLAAAVAHEINQPLMAAGTYARLVAEDIRLGAGDGGALVENAEKAVSPVERAAEVVRRLRAVFRLDRSGRAPARVERIVEECLEFCRPDLQRRNIAARAELKGPLPAIMADARQIEQVLSNLIRNSMEAIGEAGHAGGAITVRAARSGGNSVEIIIEDTGPGFPPEFAAAEPFPVSSTKAEGLGIGLFLCRSIVEAHGGSLRVAEGGEGASVRFTLPIAKPSDV